MSHDRIIRAGTLLFILTVIAAQVMILGYARGLAQRGELPVPHLRGALE